MQDLGISINKLCSKNAWIIDGAKGGWLKLFIYHYYILIVLGLRGKKLIFKLDSNKNVGFFNLI